ncbi:MAG TPA: hypothetical protein VFH94_07805, partial [Streptomyces sp.]|nr:hypothetical protein [Streptomyces sp.]
ATWAEGAAGLGHTRLATVDLVGGRQPMVLTRGGRAALVVAFTGEVYNHASLRSELASPGHRFSTRSDSEVVLHAIDAWGEQAPARLEGMFAYAAWEPGPPAGCAPTRPHPRPKWRRRPPPGTPGSRSSPSAESSVPSGARPANPA